MIRRNRSGGFTLVETLIAVAVVAAVSVAMQRGLVATKLTLARAEGIIAGEAVARGILETRLADLAASPGVRQGTTDGRPWTVTSEPLDLEFGRPVLPAPKPAETAGPTPPQPGTPPAIWSPLRVTITVETGSGPPLVVETVHLARAS